MGKYFENNMQPGIPALVKTTLGNSNLSTFLICLPPEVPDQYQMKWYLEGIKGINGLFSLMKKGDSLVQIDDLKNINWENINNKAKGSFTVKKEGFYEFLCSFTAIKNDSDLWQINKLYLQRDSESDDRLLIFDIKNDATTIEEKIDASRLLRKLKRFKQSLKLINEALEDSPKNYYAWIQKGKLYREMGKSDQSKRNNSLENLLKLH